MATTSISQCCTGVIYQPSADADLKERIIQANNKKGDAKKLEFFCIPLFAFVVYKLLESYAEKAHFPYPIEILFLNLCGSSISHLFVLIFI